MNKEKGQSFDIREHPFWRAPEEIRAKHGLEKGTVKWIAHNLLWMHQGNWKSIEEYFQRPDVRRDDKKWTEVKSFIYEEGNQQWLSDVLEETKKLYEKYMELKVRDE